jgi:hypothetical protein
LPFQGPPKYTQIGIFGTKTNHLATLIGTGQAGRIEICELVFRSKLNFLIKIQNSLTRQNNFQIAGGAALAIFSAKIRNYLRHESIKSPQ